MDKYFFVTYITRLSVDNSCQIDTPYLSKALSNRYAGGTPPRGWVSSPTSSRGRTQTKAQSDPQRMVRMSTIPSTSRSDRLSRKQLPQSHTSRGQKMKLPRLSIQPLAVPEPILVKETFSFLSLTLQDKDTHTHPQNQAQNRTF